MIHWQRSVYIRNSTDYLLPRIQLGREYAIQCPSAFEALGTVGLLQKAPRVPFYPGFDFDARKHTATSGTEQVTSAEYSIELRTPAGLKVDHYHGLYY